MAQQNEESKLVRLNKFLADHGIASRRKADEMIDNGEVQVNGRKVFELGIKIDPSKDQVNVNGKRSDVAIGRNKPENPFTPRQADAILELQLHRLTRLSIDEILTERERRHERQGKDPHAGHEDERRPEDRAEQEDSHDAVARDKNPAHENAGDADGDAGSAEAIADFESASLGETFAAPPESAPCEAVTVAEPLARATIGWYDS